MTSHQACRVFPPDVGHVSEEGETWALCLLKFFYRETNIFIINILNLSNLDKIDISNIVFTMSNEPVVRVLVFWAGILKTAFYFSSVIYFETRFSVDQAGLELDGSALLFLLPQLPQYWDCTEDTPLH